MEIKKATVYRVDYYALSQDARDEICERSGFGNDRAIELSFRWLDEDAPWESELLTQVQLQHPEFRRESDTLLVDICW